MANAHHSGYGNRAAPARGSAAAVRLARSALLAVNTAAPTAEAPSLWYLKNSQLHPALRIRLAASATEYLRASSWCPAARNRSIAVAEVIAISVYSVVQATGNTPLGGT